MYLSFYPEYKKESAFQQYISLLRDIDNNLVAVPGVQPTDKGTGTVSEKEIHPKHPGNHSVRKVEINSDDVLNLEIDVETKTSGKFDLETETENDQNVFEENEEGNIDSFEKVMKIMKFEFSTKCAKITDQVFL